MVGNVVYRVELRGQSTRKNPTSKSVWCNFGRACSQLVRPNINVCVSLGHWLARVKPAANEHRSDHVACLNNVVCAHLAQLRHEHPASHRGKVCFDKVREAVVVVHLDTITTGTIFRGTSRRVDIKRVNLLIVVRSVASQHKTCRHYVKEDGDDKLSTPWPEKGFKPLLQC